MVIMICNATFAWALMRFGICYHHVAEPLADADAKALREETVGNGARVMEYVAGTNGNPLAAATLDLYQNAGRKYMPPMSWPEVYQMYCLTADATTERGALKLVQKVHKEYWPPARGWRRLAGIRRTWLRGRMQMRSTRPT